MSAEATTLPRVKRIGDHVFVGSILPIDDAGHLIGQNDIEAQTHAVFRALRHCLEGQGAGMKDLVRLNTYYVYDGDDNGAQPFWERMTRVRLLYFPDPGPAATAVRVRGMGLSGAMIQLEAEAIVGAPRRQRIMPVESWDWSIRVPLSQGWRIENLVWVGGQISADKTGKSVAPNDAPAQTRNILHHIWNVLDGARLKWENVVHFKICYMHDGNAEESEKRLADIVAVISEKCGEPLPPITAFGVKLLYPGLTLEIDAMAVVGGQRVLEAGSRAPTAREAVNTGGYVQVAGQSSSLRPLEHAIPAALGAAVARARDLDAKIGDLAHIHVFVASDMADESPESALEVSTDAVKALGAEAPAFTLVRVNGLPAAATAHVDVVAVTAT